MFTKQVHVVLFVSYVVTLVADGVRSVRSFNFDKAAASVLTSCVCILRRRTLTTGLLLWTAPDHHVFGSLTSLGFVIKDVFIVHRGVR